MQTGLEENKKKKKGGKKTAVGEGYIPGTLGTVVEKHKRKGKIP